MNTMETLLRDLEKKITKYHGTGMPNMMLKQGLISYSVKYVFGEDDNVGTLLLMATDQDTLYISTLTGLDFDERAEVYTTPFIRGISKATQMLEKVEAIIEDSAYEAYRSDINLIAQVIKDTYEH